MEKKISLKEIAKICDVSVATVSRVINQNGRFSSETEERVRRVIEEYHYQPNQIAKGLRTSKLNTIGVIVPDITNEFFSSIVRSLQKVLFQEGYSCIIFNTDESKQIESQCVANLKTMNISGLVSIDSRLHPDEWGTNSIPFVYVDRRPENVKCEKNMMFLSSDNEDGAYQAGKELAFCGCKKVASITTLRDSSVAANRSAGFTRACADYGLELSPDVVFTPETISLNTGYEIVDQALKEGKQFDGIFCHTDWLAIGALSALLDYGIDVPEQVQVIGFDDIPVARYVQRPLTTVHQPTEQMGIKAAELILAAIDNRPIPNTEIMLPVELKRRGTTQYHPE